MQIGDYKIRRELGAGGMGIVFSALDQIGRPVAIKMIGRHADIRGTVMVNRPAVNRLALDREHRMMFVREASLAMQLTHPNIVRVFDYGRHQGLLYIVMEYLHGLSLEKLLARGHPMSLARRLSLIIQLCEALDYAHKRGVIHRDVKPNNTMVIKDFTVKVLDFGLAGKLGTTSAGCTPAYAAPESILRIGAQDERVDVWAAGVTFYKLLTGREPFTGTYQAELYRNIVHEPFPPLHKKIPHAEQLENVLNRALAKTPAERYRRAADFVKDLRRIEKSLESEKRGEVEDIEASPEPDSGETVTSSSPPTLVIPHGQHISVTSGEILSRNPNHTLRCAKWNQRAFGLALIGFPLAFVWPIVYHMGLLKIDFIRAEIALFSCACGVILPAVLAIGVLFIFPAIWQQLAEVPRCRRCKIWMEYQFQELRLAGSDIDWTHARDDCLAALKEDLWGDAAKLLSMRQEVLAPVAPSSSMRYRLEYYSCAECGDETAIFNTDYGVDSDWKPAEEYSCAYRSQAAMAKDGRISLGKRARIFSTTITRALTLVIGKMPPLYIAICLVAAFFCAKFYYPQIPTFFGVSPHRTTIAILADPPNIPLIIDGASIRAPAKFSWNLSSRHTIDTASGWPRGSHFTDPRVIIFATGDASRKQQSVPSPSGIGQAILIRPAINQWGQLETVPEISSYTVKSLVASSSESRFTSAIVTSDPMGLVVSVDGLSVRTPHVCYWLVGSTHTLTALSGLQFAPHPLPGLGPNTRVYYNLGH